MNDRTILITGGAGYIGSHTAYHLSKQGCSVIILDRVKPLWNAKFSQLRSIHGDFADTEILQSLFAHDAIDTVIHCAADIAVAESVTNPIKYYQNNVSNTLILLETMIKYGIKKCIFSSSAAVYGSPQAEIISEDYPTNPINPYGMSKLMGEKILEDISKAHDFSYVILRYFNVAGASHYQELNKRHSPARHVIPLLISACLHEKPFTIFGTDYSTLDGTAVRDYIHVMDIAQAHERAIHYLHAHNAPAIFNIGSGRGTSIKQLISATENFTGKKLILVESIRRPGDPMQLVADTQKAQKYLRWYPESTTLEAMLKSSLPLN